MVLLSIVQLPHTHTHTHTNLHVEYLPGACHTCPRKTRTLCDFLSCQLLKQYNTHSLIPRSLLWVTEDLIGLLYSSEGLGTLFNIVRILVRMKLERQSPVGLLQIGI